MTADPPLPTWLESLVSELSQGTDLVRVRASAVGPGEVTEVDIVTRAGGAAALVGQLRELCRQDPSVYAVHWTGGPVRGDARVVLARTLPHGRLEPCVVRIRSHPERSRPWRRGGRSRGGGVNVVLYGPDGVGKSTAGERLCASLVQLGVPQRQVVGYHAFVPTQLLERRAASGVTALKTRSYARSSSTLARGAMLVLSYVKRLALLHLRVRPHHRRGVVTVHDRYLLDVFLKARKTWTEPLPRLERSLSRLTPRGDLPFLLRADEAVVSARTGELTAEEVRETYAVLDRCLAARGSHHREVDANGPAGEVHRMLLHQLLERQTRRFVAQ